MSVNYNQLRKKYNQTVSEIPEEQLKKLFNKLFFQLYCQLYIENDNESYEKTFATLESLINETEQWKRFRASREAIVEVPHLIIAELQKQANHERSISISVYLLSLASDTELYDSLIGYIDNCNEKNSKKCLEVIKKDLEKIRDKTDEILSSPKNQKIYTNIISNFEDKNELSEIETETLKKLKDLEALYG